MKPSTYQSPDGLIGLKSEPTSTINRHYPDGFEDWIIELTPGGWHVHPDLLSREYSLPPEQASERFIAEILSGNRLLVLRYHEQALREVSILDHDCEPLESQLEQLHRQITIDERAVIRTWSGTVMHRLRPLPGRIVTNRNEIHRLYRVLESNLGVPPRSQRVEAKPMRCFVETASSKQSQDEDHIDLSVLSSYLLDNQRAIFFSEMMYIHDADYPFSTATLAELQTYYSQRWWQHDEYIFDPNTGWCLMITHDDHVWFMDRNTDQGARSAIP